jgi:transcriptional regulator with XRE-family HTH domain
MYVNTKIVTALLTLRALSLKQLADVTGISRQALSAWLDGTAKDDDERLSFERQLEVIKVLGIVGEHPRADVTHNWYLREPAFGDRGAIYEPLRLMLLCFGRCEVTHIAANSDPYVAFSARTHFGLTFEKFRAVLEITSSPLRSLVFDPRSLPNMHWVGEEAPLIVTDESFNTLITPGETTPAALDKARVKALAPARWAKLAQLAEERGMGAPELAHYLIENVPVKPALTHKPEAQATKPQAPETNDLFFTPDPVAKDAPSVP